MSDNELGSDVEEFDSASFPSDIDDTELCVLDGVFGVERDVYWCSCLEMSDETN